MNRREMKNILYRELGNFLGQRRRQWSSIPNFFEEMEVFIFKGSTPTQAEEYRLNSVINEMIIQFLKRGRK